jgi:hypothetical protein
MSKTKKKVAKKVVKKSKAAAAKSSKKGAKKRAVKKAAPVKKPAAKKAPAKKKTAGKAAPKAVKKIAKKPIVKAKAVPVPKAKTKGPKKKEESAKKIKAPPVEVVEAYEDELEGSPIEGEPVEEVILTDAEGRRYCRVRDCDQLASVDGYCRYHYLLFWKRIQVRKKILTEGKLERYVEDLTARYPDKFLDMLRKDLRSEKEFLAAIQELEIDEGNEEGDFEDEDQSFIDEVRGMSETAGGREDEDY